jgi:biotin carboxylase
MTTGGPKRVVVVRPVARDRRLIEDAGLDRHYAVHYAEADPGPFDVAGYLDRLARLPADGVVGTHDNSALLAALAAERRGLPGPTPAAVFSCHYKPACRDRLRPVVGDALPRYAVFDGANAFEPPFFVKPVIGRNSGGARRVDDPAELRPAMLDDNAFARGFVPIAELMGLAPADAGRYLMEELLTGVEVTVEGYVFGGRWTTIGITDSIKYPGTASFEHFDYPTALPAERQGELTETAARVASAVGFDGGMLNIELFVPEHGPCKVTEVNPRICSQYTRLVHALHGRSTYQVLFQLACGEDPCWRAEPPDGVAVSYCLRTFADGCVESVPEPEPGLEVLVKPGLRLSEQGQNDSFSYRLALVYECGETAAEALRRCRERAGSLRFGIA